MSRGSPGTVVDQCEWRRGPALLGLVALAALSTAPSCNPDLVPVFDYSVPARFQVPEPQDPRDASPTADHYFQGPLLPASWPVDLDGCASSGPIARYAWHVDGQLVASSASCSGARFLAPAEGTYQVTLTLEDSDGGASSLTRSVVVQDWLIFGLGDSYGSGEGSPDRPIDPAQVDAVAAARNVLDSAVAAAAEALAAEVLAQEDLAALLNLTGAVLRNHQVWRDAVAARNAACNPLNFPPTPVLCVQAQAAASTAATQLVVSLTALGLQAIFGQPNLVAVILNLEDSARSALDFARGVRLVAEAAVVDAQDALADELALLAPRWQSRQCHRSSRSGQVEAARRLEEADPRTSVTFIHLACSGATIPQGLVGAYEGQEPAGLDPALPPQVHRVAQLAGGREIDALVVSIGGNDVGFADIITACMVNEPCFLPVATVDPSFASFALAACATVFPLDGICTRTFDWIEERGQDLNAGRLFAEGLAQLPGAFDEVAQALADRGWSTARAPLHLTAYPQITTREDGSGGIELCGFDPTASPAENQQELFGWTSPEFAWAALDVTPSLNGAMGTASLDHGWQLVDSHVAAFDGHGYCADANWIVRLRQSIWTQASAADPAQSFNGSVHPNAAGYQAYASAIHDSLRCDFYPGCDTASLPRGPRDGDADGVPDERDTCVDAADADQRDTDGDGFGNRCDADLDGNGLVTADDLTLMKAVFFTGDPDADLNGDGVVDFLDLGILNTLMGSPPGPSGAL